MNNKYYLIGLCVAAAIYLLLVDDDNQDVGQINISQSPDYYIYGLTYRQFSPSGELDYVFHADSATHSESEKFTRYGQPHFEWNNDAKKWILDATYAYQNHKSNDINLSPNVIVQGTITSQNLPVTIKTDSLDINLDTRQLTSQGPVEFDSPKMSGTAGGFSANLNSQSFKLYDHVRQTYH